MDSEAKSLTFWDRLTARASEKFPERFPTPSSVTQKAAGKLIGKSQNAGFKWKHGILPERKHMAELAVQLDVAVEWLETGRGPKFVPAANDPVSAEIFRLVADADELRKMEFLNFLQYVSDRGEAKTATSVRYLTQVRRK